MSVKIRLMGNKEKVRILAKGIEALLGEAGLSVEWAEYKMFFDRARTKVDEKRIRLYGTVRER